MNQKEIKLYQKGLYTDLVDILSETRNEPGLSLEDIAKAIKDGLKDEFPFLIEELTKK